MRMIRNSPVARSPAAVVAFAVLFGVMVLATGRARAEFEGKRLPQPMPLPIFALLDHQGMPFEKARFAGKWSVVFPGYTSCPDVCPYTLANVVATFESLAAMVTKEEVLQIVFVAVDPDRDRPVLGEYVKHFGDGVIGVTGDVPELKKFISGLGAFFRYGRKSRADGSYMVFHSAQVNVVDPEARVAARMNPPFDPEAAARFLADLIKAYRTGT